MSVKDGPSSVLSSLDLDIDFANIKGISGSNALDLSVNGYTVQTINPSSNTTTIANGYCTFNPTALSDTSTFYRVNAAPFIASYTEMSLETCVYTTSDITGSNWPRNRPISPRTNATPPPMGFGLGYGYIGVEYSGSGSGNVGQDVNGYYGGNATLSSVDLGKWIYITQTISTTLKEFKTYINGELAVNVAANSAPSAFNGFDIGRGYYDVSCNYMGRISFLKVYKKALTAAEVSQNFNARRGRFGL
jgi:hypothetical protein